MKILFLICLYSGTLLGQATSQEATRQVGRLVSGLETLQRGAPDLCEESGDILRNHRWRAGAPDCEAPGAKEPPFETVQVDAVTFVLRQNKCINFEAPFVYLYIGNNQAFLFDTGATQDDSIRRWVDETLARLPNGQNLELIVAHSHSHGDHMAGDSSFQNRPRTRIIGSSPEEVATAFGIQNWPAGNGRVDLGGRPLTIIPVPGHESSSIAVYDSRTRDMLTGDSFYPGNIFLSEETFPAFRESISRLHAFTRTNPVRNFLGAHIEISQRPGEAYEYGKTYQPDEHRLPLTQENLDELQNYLATNPAAGSRAFSDFLLTL